MARIPLTLTLLVALAGLARSAPPPAFDDAALRAVQFVDGREGWAAGDDGAIWHTIDGGQTWERQKAGTRATLTSIHFLTPYTGFIAGRTELPGDLGSGGVLLATTDGGITWADVSNGLLPGLNVVKFFDDKTGLVAGDGCGAYPGGAFTTADGGKIWRPVVGPLAGSWMAADCADAKTERSAGSSADRIAHLTGTLVGAWGKAATLQGGEMTAKDLGIPGGRAVRAVKANGKTAFAVGDGGLVLANRDYPAGAWASVDLPLPAEARGVCDFHAVAVVGDNVWLAGRPGSVVLHSPDNGATWAVRPTGSQVPLHALHMQNDKTGWAVGDLGTVLKTTDGGRTWKHLRGKLHAAVLTAHATPKGVPLTLFPVVGAADGYLTATMAITCADAATADPKRAADPFRLSSAIRLAGGAAAETGWAFSLPGHCDGLTADGLRAYWDRLHDGRAAESLVRQMTLAIRVWRPEVIVTDSVMPDAPAAEQLVLATMQEAFKRAADPAAYPEQIATLGLKPHAAKKLYGTMNQRDPVQLSIPDGRFVPEIADTPATMSAAARSLTGGQLARAQDGIVTSAMFRLVSHRDEGAGKHRHLMDGTSLAAGGMARRADPKGVWAFTPDHLTAREKAVAAQGHARMLRVPGKAREMTPDSLGKFLDGLKDLPPADAAEVLADEAPDLPAASARELYQYAVDRHPAHPTSLPAYRWLTQYHAGTETLRRIELGQMTSLRPAEFYELTGDIVQASATEGASPEKAKFRTAEARRDWFATGPSLEGKLFAVNPLLSREPAQQLAFHAARLKMGLTADAEKALTNYHRAVVGRPVTPGANPWFDAVAAELHLLNPTLVPTCPKPLAACRKVAARPTLDGKLDDAVWAGTTELTLGEGTKELSISHGTTARLAFDDEYLYLGVTCRHPQGEQVPLAADRKHDDDVTPHDRVELLLDLDRDYATYYRLRVDHRGCTAEDCWGDATWNPQWFVAVTPSPTGWTAEVAIPLAELTGLRPRDKHVWAANVVRVLPGRGVLSWAGPADATPRPEGMGLLEFRAK